MAKEREMTPACYLPRLKTTKWNTEFIGFDWLASCSISCSISWRFEEMAFMLPIPPVYFMIEQ